VPASELIARLRGEMQRARDRVLARV